MKNVTISLPDEVARQARIWAAEADTSLSQYLGGILEERMERESAFRRAREDYFSREPAPLRKPLAPYPDREALHDRSALR